MKLLSYLTLFTFLFGATSCLNQEGGQTIPGVNGPIINVQNGRILMSVELENFQTPVGVEVPLRNLNNSSIALGPAIREDGTFGGTLLRVAFDLTDVENNDFITIDPQTLPDGRPFPFGLDGSIPAYAVTVPDAKNMTFYASRDIFGFFLPLNLPDDIILSVSYRLVINGEDIGAVQLVQPDQNGENAGLLAILSLDVIKTNKKFLRLLEISKKNKHRIY